MAANKILIVENDGIICISMEELLASQGFEVMAVLPSGEAALELVKAEQPDLIIMDIMLAGELDGISTAQQIKEVAHVPVIYLTAYANDELIRRARETAPHAYLVKPVQERELIATVEMTLHRHGLEEQLKKTEASLQKRELELREAHQQLLTILNSMNSGVYVADMETHEILFANHFLQNIYGKIQGEKCWQTLQRDQAGPCPFCNNNILLDGAGRTTGVHQREFQNTRNGRWYDCHDTALQWSNGRMVRLEIFADITEKKLQQEQLEQEKDELNTLLEEMLDTVAVWVSIMDKDGNVTFWNKAGAAISGYAEAEVGGNKQIWEWLFPDPDYKDEVVGQIRTIMREKGKVEHFETVIQSKDGQQRNILWYANTLTVKGRRMGTLVLGTDITLRKEAEEALRNSEEHYRLLVNNANEGIIVVQGTEIKFANPMALKNMGCTAARLKTTPFSYFVHPADWNIFLERHRQRKKGGKVRNPQHFRLVDARGGQKTISMNSVTIKWDGAPAILAMMTDITALKKMEEENIKRQKLDSIGILAGGIAHDFNNYLATLMGNISLAKIYHDQPQKMVEKLDNLERATMNAQQLSNQLFAFAKGSEPIKKKVSLEQIITHNVNFALSGSNVQPYFDLAADLHPAEVDEGQFGQVLSNIVINATQAMPDGGKIEVRAENILPEGQGKPPRPSYLENGKYVFISIKDEGMGIPEKHLDKVFDPYFTTKQKGSGLGLASSYTIMQKHGGHLSVTSKVGVGSTFYLLLPAAATAETRESEPSKIYYGSGRILLMDDQEAYRQVMGENLSTLGYEVSLASQGREAVELYIQAQQAGRPFDLVILDLTIPGGMGGKQTIKKLLKIDPHVKAIVASGYSSDPILASHTEYGFKGTIKKPFTLEELSEVVFTVMQ